MVATDPDAAMTLVGQQLGIEAEMIPPQRRSRVPRVLKQGKLYRLPEGFVLMRPTRMLPMLTTRCCRVSGKARLAMDRSSLGEVMLLMKVSSRLWNDGWARTVTANRATASWRYLCR